MKVDNDINLAEFQYMKLWTKDNILYCLYRPFLTITREVALTCLEDRLKFVEGKTYPMFSDVRGVKFIDRDARICMAEDSSLKNLSAEAVFISTQQEKFLWSLYININKPSIATKLFSNQADALDWLHQFKG